MLMSCLAAIAADNYSHVQYFGGRRDAYDDYYDIVVDIGEVAVPEFATRVQELLVDYLRETYGDGPADWCRDFWTGDRGRMCLAHACYAGSNNNMGVEVSWRLIKKICSELACLSAFIGALCKFIRKQLGEEHMHRLRKAGDPNAFIRAPKPTKEMYDAVQDMHPKTLSMCFIVYASPSTSKRNVDVIFRDMVETVMESGRSKAPLHRKVLAYHYDLTEQGERPPLELLDLKTVLMPRQWLRGRRRAQAAPSH